MKKQFILLVSILFIIQAVVSQPTNPWTPPEYFPSKAVLIEWDFNSTTWPLYSELIEESSFAVPVILVVNNLSEENQMRTLLTNDGVSLVNISFVHVPCERMWIRDHGPLAVKTDNGVAYIDFDDLAGSGADELLPTNLALAWGLQSYQLPYIFDGGNFMVDSYNTLYTTTRVYSNNPSYSQSVIDNAFETYMGITDIITFKAQHNDYWGHIDMQMKLLDDTTFIICSVSQGSGPNYDSLEANYNKLLTLTGPHGKPYRIMKIPMADNWKTYANSVILNNTVLIPFFNHALDSTAYNIYQQLLPTYTIVGINSNSIIGWEGSLHCITMQLFDDTTVSLVHSLSLKDKVFEVYPNPISPGSTLHILLSQDSVTEAVIHIYNMSGKIIKALHSPDGKNVKIAWDFPPGSYIVEVVTQNGRSSKTIVVQ